jgi:hypothetical protein
VEKHLVRVDIDVEKNPGGEKVYEEYGPQRGLPAWSVLDPSRKVVADSVRDKQNVGFPYEAHEVTHFFDALRKACPGLGEDELKVLKDRLAEHGKARRAETEHPKKDPGQR